jgi:hypothetical protein
MRPPDPGDGSMRDGRALWASGDHRDSGLIAVGDFLYAVKQRFDPHPLPRPTDPSHHFIAANPVTRRGTHNRGEYDSQFIDFDAEFHLSLESRNAILKVFYMPTSSEG